MANKKSDKKEDEIAGQPSKKSGIVTSIIAVVILSAVAIGAGWFVASQNSSTSMVGGEGKPAKKMAKKPKADHGKKSDKDGHGDEGGEHKNEDIFTKLEPFIVNLPRSGNSLIRLELGMVAENGYPITRPATQAEIVDEISTYLKTIELKLYSGPSGYLHLREDLLERAQLTSKGKIRKVFILSMAVE